MLQVLVRRDTCFEATALCPREELAILERRPAHRRRGRDLMFVEMPLDRRSRTSIEQQFHYGAFALCAACSRTALTCESATPGNHSTKSVTCAPSSRFRKRAETGTRLPRNTQAPLTRAGSRSTSEHEDQSITPGCCARSPRRSRADHDDMRLHPGVDRAGAESLRDRGGRDIRRLVHARRVARFDLRSQGRALAERDRGTARR